VLTGDKFKNLSLFFHHALLFHVFCLLLTLFDEFDEELFKKKAHNSFPREFITLKGVCVS